MEKYTVGFITQKLRLSKLQLAEILGVDKSTTYAWNNKNEGVIPDVHYLKLKKLLDKQDDGSENLTQDAGEELTVEYVLKRLNLRVVDLAKKIGSIPQCVSKWKRTGIPEKYQEKIKKLLAGEPVVEVQQDFLPMVMDEKKPKRTKQIQIQEIKPSTSDGPVVALVGKPQDILKVLREMNFTKD